MKKIRVLVFFIFIFLLAIYAYYKEEKFEKQEVVIEQVIDGDTLIVKNNETERIRLKGINAPEKEEADYEEAINFLNSHSGKEAVLAYDIEDKRDKYGRVLAYVFVNKTLINEEILENGLAHVFYYSPDIYTRKLEKAEKRARTSEKGIWKKSVDNCKMCVMLERLDNGESKDDCKAGAEKVVLYNKCEFSCNLTAWSLKDDATHLFWFNEFVLEAENYVTIYNGKGKDNETSFFWQNSECASIWNDDGDSLFLRDENGLLVLFHRY